MKKVFSLLSILLMLAVAVPGMQAAYASDDEREREGTAPISSVEEDDESDDDDSDRKVRRRGLAVRKHRRAMQGVAVTEDCFRCHDEWAAEPPVVVEPPVTMPPVVEPPIVVEPPVTMPPVVEPPADVDGDGVADAQDSCQNTPANELVNANGCSASQLDSDRDGVSDAKDLCENTPAGIDVDANGCTVVPADTDNDGVIDANDACANTPSGEAVDNSGCGASQLDSDNDRVTNDKDQCPGTASGVQVDAVGCEVVQTPSILKAPAETLCRSCHGFENPANSTHSRLQQIHGQNCSFCHNF